MKTDCKKYLILFFLIMSFTWIISCSGRSGNDIKKPETNQPSAESIPEPVAKMIRIVSPEEDAGYKLHQVVKVSLEIEGKTQPDSVAVYFDGNRIASLKSSPWEVQVPATSTVSTGRKSLKVSAYRSGRTQNTVTRFVIIYSDVVPKRYGYKVINTYPHSRDAFTQGLVYDNGILYEGTGQETGSSVREVELKTGKVLRQHDLDDALFGEGIALYHDRIYQVTWKNYVGFIYNKSDFSLISKIHYSTQGWGLTTMNDKIVLSDGTNILYFYEPEMFTVVSKIEVYDNEKKVDQLNELEYINGEIWANIWMTDLIARIDPVSGKVLAYIDLKDILPKSDRNDDTDVLNGIAYDRSSGKIYVTGKKWPKLFEIKLTE